MDGDFLIGAREFGAELAEIVGEGISDATGPLERRIAELEQMVSQLVAKLNERSLQDEALAKRLHTEITERFSELPAPEPGKPGENADLTEVVRLVSAERKEMRSELRSELVDMIAALPRPKDGSPGQDADIREVERLIADNALAVKADLRAELSEALADLPAPAAGAPGKDAEAVAAILLPQLAERLKHGETGKDGVGLADALVDRQGHLALTMTDGRIVKLGLVVGRDGAHGKDFDYGEFTAVLNDRLERFRADLHTEIQTRAAPLAAEVDNLRSAFESRQAEATEWWRTGLLDLKRYVDDTKRETVSGLIDIDSKLSEIAARSVQLHDDVMRAARSEIEVLRRDLEQAQTENAAAHLSAISESVLRLETEISRKLMDKVNISDVERISGTAIDTVLKDLRTETAAGSEQLNAVIDRLTLDLRGEIATKADANELKHDLSVAAKNLGDLRGEWSAERDALREALPTEVNAAVTGAVKSAIEALPVPADGHSPTPEEMAPEICKHAAAAVGEYFAAHPLPASVVDTLIDQDGVLHVILSDATTKRVGKVVGADGVSPNQKEIVETAIRHVQTQFDALPKPRDGRDGFGFEDLNVEYDGKRTITFVFRRDGQERRFPVRIQNLNYRNIYKEGEVYEQGDVVTYGGSAWVAESHPTGRPEEGKSGWRLAVKTGRPGASGKDADETRIKKIEEAITSVQRQLAPMLRRFNELPQ